MLADSLTKTGYPARAVIESFLVKKRWRCTFDHTFDSGRRRKARGAPLFNQEDLDEISPKTESVAFDTLLQDESLSEDVREIMRMKHERHRRVSSEWSKIEEKFWSMQDMYTRLLSANLDFDSELQHVFRWAPDECRDSRVFHVDRVFLRLCWTLFSCLAWVHRTLHVVGSFDENTRFSGHGMLFSWIPRKLSCPWYRCCLVDSGGRLLNTWL